MKYEIRLHRHESKEVTIEAKNRDEALKKARQFHPSFTVGLVCDKRGGEHEPETACENCECTIWAGEKYITTSDDVTLCPECARALSK